MRPGEQQSFSQRVKEELVRQPVGKPCCMLSEIAALTMTSGHLALRGRGNFSVSYRIENVGAARRLLILLRKRLNVNPVLHWTQTGRLGGRRVSVLTVSGEDARTLLGALHMIETDESGDLHLKRAVPRHPLTRSCCRRAFFRGAFLGAGSVTHPDRGYHLEWKAEDDQLLHMMEKLLLKSDLPCHTYDRKGRQVIYLKGAQQIADALAMMGASASLLEMENIRIRKQLRATAARAANCDEHNGDKMVDAALRQTEAIRQISLRLGLFTLPPALQELARLRLENPELGLKELGEQLSPPIGKSGVNHRMRRLMEIAAKLEEENPEENPEGGRDR